MARILLVSNGHGEDLSGAILGNCLRRLGHKVNALPLVGIGSNYTYVNIEIIGKTKEYSTGGLGYTSLKGRLTEILQGQVFYLIGRLLKLLSEAKKYDLLITVGDVIPIVAAWLSKKATVAYLVAYSSHYEGTLRLPWPCKQCLLSKRFLRIYSRDQLTADDLSNQLSKSIEFLGNPFMDNVLKVKAHLPHCEYRLGILPGSRRPELDKNLSLLLKVLEKLPINNLNNQQISLDLALVESLDDLNLEKIVSRSGWNVKRSSKATTITQLQRSHFNINIHRNAFISVLQSSDAILSMAGTASEQAIGLAKPVIQVPGYGPQFTSSFAEAQRRLLGPTIFCADGAPGKEQSLSKTAIMIMELLKKSKTELGFQEECQRQAGLRLGRKQGGVEISKAIHNLLTNS